MSQVTYKVPDFIGPDGTEYTEIEVIVETDGSLAEAAHLADSLNATPTRRCTSPAELDLS